MSDSYRDLHGDAYKEWREQQADDYVQAQRRAFLDGFESAAKESQNFRLLRQWLEEQRDESMRKHNEREDDETMFVKYLAFKEVLVKLHEMGCMPEPEDAD